MLPISLGEEQELRVLGKKMLRRKCIGSCDGRSKEEPGEHLVTRSFIICTHHSMSR
jgi:hypothetical protein